MHTADFANDTAGTMFAGARDRSNTTWRILPRWNDRTASAPLDAENAAAVGLLSAVLAVGLATASDYGISIDEFNADDYGPKALAWYTSAFTDRSHFDTVESTLWYYGPWFQILTAFVQSFGLADRFTVRHAVTFLVGLAGVAALLPIGRLAVGRWAGLIAIALCLITGCFYGSLFFTPIDVPFMAVMTWGTLAILVTMRRVLPSWPATIATGLLAGLALGTRTGGIIILAYLAAALVLCALEFGAIHGRLTLRYLIQIAARYASTLALAFLTAIAIWPWLQVGNPFEQLKIALVHFARIPASFDFLHWGERVWTNDLPLSYIPGQLLARLPLGFPLLLAISLACGIVMVARFALRMLGKWRGEQRVNLRAAALILARQRAILIVFAAVVLPLAFLIVSHATLYDGIRHVLFVIPMLAVLASAGFVALLPWLRRSPMLTATIAGGCVGSAVLTLAELHPLEYVAMNAVAGGTRGAYQRFDLDYWSVAATEAVRRLERRLDYDPDIASAETPPSIAICIPWREWAVAPMLQRAWVVEIDPNKAEYIIETERWRCAGNVDVVLIDEVRRFNHTFAWIYARAKPNPSG